MTFTNPYLSVPDTDCTRTTILIPFAVSARMKRYEPKTGVRQTTISILLEKLLHELESNSNIQPGDRYGYQAAVADCSIVLNSGKRSPAPVASNGDKPVKPAKTPRGNDGRRTKPLALPTQGSQQPADA